MRRFAWLRRVVRPRHAVIRSPGRVICSLRLAICSPHAVICSLLSGPRSIALVTILAGAGAVQGSQRDAKVGGFVIEHVLVLPGSPEAIYDALTGDISAAAVDGGWQHFLFERFKPWIESGKHLERPVKSRER